jgi:hypothetical protein
MKKLLTLIAVVPVLALFGGIGVLSWRISETWSEATTQSLVTGLTVVCGGGALVVCVLLALIVGVPLAVRIFGEAGISHRAWGGGGRTAFSSPWDDVPLPSRRLPLAIDGQWRELPPPSARPPWGATGGGNPQLLPPPQQDSRFGLDS